MPQIEHAARWHLPYLLASQAQKEITHNEAITLIDALLHPIMQEIIADDFTQDEIENLAPGTMFLIDHLPVPDGSFEFYPDHIAYYTGNDFRFIAPQPYLRIYIESRGVWLEYLPNIGWKPLALFADPFGNGVKGYQHEQLIQIEELTDGSNSIIDTGIIIPARTLILSLHSHIISTLEGTLHWQIGIQDDPDRYGNITSVFEGTSNIGASYHPIFYYQDTPLILTTPNGTFTRGTIHATLLGLQFQTAYHYPGVSGNA